MDRKLTKKEKLFMDSLAKHLIINAFEMGEVIPEDLESKEKFKEALDKFRKSLGSKGDVIDMAIDYKELLLKRAEAEFSDNNVEFAALFIGMYFEHSTNYLILTISEKKGFTPDTIKSLMKLAFTAKLTWVFEILNLPLYRLENIKMIQKFLNTVRNPFVHYKYPVKDGEVTFKEYRFKEIEIKKAITYHKHYITKQLYNGNKGRLKNLLK